MKNLSLNQRARSVLDQVVTLHYRSCGPVASSHICKTRAVPFSPATIRGILARLEDNGLLRQPHTSAGRLPTDLGYRTYVNGLTFSFEPLNRQEQLRLDQEISSESTGPAVLKRVADYLQSRTGLLSFYFPFRNSGIRMRGIHIQRVNPDLLTVVWISMGGKAYQHLLPIPVSEMNQAFLDKIENYLNANFQGCSLIEVAQRMAQSPVRQQDLLIQNVARLVRAMEAEALRYDHISFQGVSALLEMPEFQSAENLKDLFEVMEEKTRIHRQVHRAIEEDSQNPIVVYIGTEMGDPALNNLTIIMAKLKSRRNWLGCVGLMGPKRMPYIESLQALSFAMSRIAQQDA